MPMRLWRRLIMVVASVALATSGGVAVAPGAGVAAGFGAGVAAVPGRAAAPPTVPCPRAVAKLPKGVKRPPRPSPPAADPALREVGGAELATAGLAVAPGGRRPPAVTATSWLVADLDTGQVLGACGAHEYATPASVQKLLLAAVVMPRLDPKRMITVTRADLDFEPGSSAVGLLLGGRYPVRTLWLGLLLSSGNDAANVLARLGGGTAGVPGTIAAMNAEARRLGAFQTHAVTPSGLDGPGQFTSAYDLALIARVCFANKDFRGYARAQTAQIPKQPPKDKRGFQIQNDNSLIYEYPGALGGKTGFTDLARHTYVGAAERGGRRLVVTLLGAEARPLRGWQQGAALLDWGFSLPRDTSVGHLVGPEEVSGADAGAARSGASAAPESSGGGAGAGVGSVSMVQSMAGAGLVLIATVPVVLVGMLIRRRGPRRRRAGDAWRDPADIRSHRRPS